MQSSKTLIDATLTGTFIHTRPYFDQLRLETIDVTPKQRRHADQTIIDQLRPHLEDVGVVNPIGVRVVHGNRPYELVYGVETFLICESQMEAAEHAVAAENSKDRSLYVKLERWAEIPCRVFSADTTDEEVSRLETASKNIPSDTLRKHQRKLMNDERQPEQEQEQEQEQKQSSLVRRKYLINNLLAVLQTNVDINTAKRVVEGWWSKSDSDNAFSQLENEFDLAAVKRTVDYWWRTMRPDGRIVWHSTGRLSWQTGRRRNVKLP
jgi:hypothetical protein